MSNFEITEERQSSKVKVITIPKLRVPATLFPKMVSMQTAQLVQTKYVVLFIILHN